MCAIPIHRNVGPNPPLLLWEHPCEGATSVVCSWLAGLLTSTPVLPGESGFLSINPPKQPQRGKDGIWNDQEGAGSLQSSRCSLPAWLGCVCWSLLKEGSSPGKLASFHCRSSRSTSRSQSKILRADITTL